MKTVTWIVLAAIALVIIGLALWFVFIVKPQSVPDAAQEKVLLDAAANTDVIIIFNSGGWGNTAIAAAPDFAPILAGIQDTLASRGFSSKVVPFVRTQRGLTGKIEDIKDYLTSLKYSSAMLAAEVDYLLENAPGKKVIIAGLSNGAGLTEKAMQKLGDKPGIYAISAGIPKFYHSYTSDSILNLDNGGKDTLSSGKYWSVVGAIVRAPYVYVRAKFRHENLKFALSIEIPGHLYPWASPEVGPPIVGFIDAHF
jgi:hypothetical protein